MDLDALIGRKLKIYLGDEFIIEGELKSINWKLEYFVVENDSSQKLSFVFFSSITLIQTDLAVNE